MTSLLQLPDEILSLVATCCDCLSLKQLRLCCKRLSRISEQPLFQSLTVSTRHDEKLRLVRQHPTIANQVKSIVWDFQNDGREDAVDDQAMPDPQNAATKMESVFRSFPNLYRMGQKNTFSEPANFLNWCTTTLRARSHAISIFRAFQEESQLSELEICTPWSTFADPNESLGPLARAFRTLLLRPEGAAIDCQLKDCLDDVVFTRTFTQLNKLTLALDVPCPEAEAIELTLEGRVVNEVETYRLQGAYARLGRLLNNQRKLKVLHVRFRPRRPWARGLASHPLMSDYTLFPPYLFGSNSFYPRLSSLTIAGYLTNAESWLKFLRKASHTLRYLHLENIGLMTPAEVSTAIITALTLPVNGPTTITSPAQSTRDTLLRTACWVAVLTEMRQILRLKQISLNGDFVSLVSYFSSLLYFVHLSRSYSY
jgi:hypothetical protein